jgi:hypothetical protein
MDALAAATATATANAVSTVSSHFMLDGATYKRGAELGFSGLDFYITGRGGVLGDVDADVVSAAFSFFEPGHVRTQWEAGRVVLPAALAADAFASCGEAWAEAHVPDDLDAERLAELAGRVVAGARPACAPVFAAWRARAVPTTPKAAALHQMNALRELRNGLHGAAVVSSGLTPLEAVSLRSPHMVALFGWAEPAPTDGLQPLWDTAEASTTAAIAHAYEALDDDERDELTALASALHEATKG